MALTAFTSRADQVKAKSAGFHHFISKPIDMDRLRSIKTGQGPNGGPLVNIMPPDVMQEWLQSSWSVVLTDDFSPADNLVAPLFVDRSF